jgi:hypothetical protein
VKRTTTAGPGFQSWPLLAINEGSPCGLSQTHSARRGPVLSDHLRCLDPAVFLLAPVLNNAGYIAGPGADTRVLLGCFLDLVNALACIGTA